MPKQKLRRYAELLTFKNVFEPSFNEIKNGYTLKGKWASSHFNNDHPIVLELGCGKGEYTVNLAKQFPDKNFIGIDIKGDRMWRGSKSASEEQLHNVVFIRLDIANTDLVFDTDEISEIWITFPDPQPKNRQAKKRLTNPLFLQKYKRFLLKDGIIHLKTDNVPLFEYTLEVIEREGHQLLKSTNDLYSIEKSNGVFEIKTFYEKKFLAAGLPICYLKFSLTG